MTPFLFAKYTVPLTPAQKAGLNAGPGARIPSPKRSLTRRVLDRARVRTVILEILFGAIVAVGMGFATVFLLG